MREGKGEKRQKGWKRGEEKFRSKMARGRLGERGQIECERIERRWRGRGGEGEG